MDINQLEKVWEPWLKKGDYQLDFKRHLKNRAKFYQLINAYIKENTKRILEVGCGTAIDSNILSAEHKNTKFYATDISEKSVLLAKQICNQTGNKMFLAQGDLNKLFFKDKTFDVIFSQGVLEHFTDPLTVIKEQVRTLKDDGVLIISIPQTFTGYTLMKKLKMRNKTWEWEWETEYSHGKLKRLCANCGLSAIDALGYQYWLSWWEPAWVMRDFVDKFYRRIQCTPLLWIKNIYDELWNFLEQRWGIYFSQNLAMAFIKSRCPQIELNETSPKESNRK